MPLGQLFCGGSRCGELQTAASILRAVCENRGALDGVLQFADVARPGIGAAGGARASSVKCKRRLAKFAAETFQEMFGEQQNVVAAVAQRRNGDGHGGDAEVEILAE